MLPVPIRLQTSFEKVCNRLYRDRTAEPLELRKLFSVVVARDEVWITGSAKDDTYLVDGDASQVTVIENGVTRRLQPESGFELLHLNANLAEGDDSITFGTRFDMTTFVFGDAGNDTVQGGGSDNDFGGTHIYGGDGSDVLRGTTGADKICGDAGNDKIDGLRGSDTIYGGMGNDTLTGDANRDILRGEDGDDRLYGGRNDDLLFGGAGVDHLYGSAGDDRLDGGLGRDFLYGSGGPSIDYSYRDTDHDTARHDAGDRVIASIETLV